MRPILSLFSAAVLLVSACAQMSTPPPPAPQPPADSTVAAPSISITAPAAAPGQPSRAPATYNSVYTTKPVIALTFDDGPHPELTPRLLDILRAEGVRATFYVVGQNVDAHPDIARRIVAEGHEIANHSWSHASLPGVSAGRLAQEIEKTNEAIERATGRRPTNMRPPYGALNERVRKVINNDYGLDIILWSVDPLDWKRPGAAVVTQRLVQGAHPGAILLAHDIHPGTVEAVPETIARLKAKGYGFATVSQLLALRETPPPPTPKPTPAKPTKPGAPAPPPVPASSPLVQQRASTR
ncbi:MAG: polysaccharide deacetylase family protein [Chthoniobacterales bacterium]